MKNKVNKLLFVSAVFFAVLLVGNIENVYAQRGNNRSGRIEWRGTVDDRVQLIIRGRTLRVRTLSGRRYNKGTTYFSSSLPNRGNEC